MSNHFSSLVTKRTEKMASSKLLLFSFMMLFVGSQARIRLPFWKPSHRSHPPKHHRESPLSFKPPREFPPFPPTPKLPPSFTPTPELPPPSDNPTPVFPPSYTPTPELPPSYMPTPELPAPSPAPY
ncbi:hypothetical protein N665_0188s0142 [Sinapis alba]|nr:hypothetical protein N665_0188s0142 [Sinapis alba]